MVRSAGVSKQSASEGTTTASDQQSLGDLVALAAKDVSQLIRYEMDLAKSEFKADAKRAAFTGALFGFSAFVGCLILVLLTFALAYGLHAFRFWGTDGMQIAFLYSAVICILFAAILAGAAVLILKRFSKMKQTRKTVTDDLSMLRRRDPGADTAAKVTANGVAPKSVAQGTAPEISGGRPLRR